MNACKIIKYQENVIHFDSFTTTEIIPVPPEDNFNIDVYADLIEQGKICDDEHFMKYVNIYGESWVREIDIDTIINFNLDMYLYANVEVINIYECSLRITHDVINVIKTVENLKYIKHYSSKPMNSLKKIFGNKYVFVYDEESD